MAESPEIVWMTYREAGDRLGIKTDSVRRRAASRKWERRPGNDGKTRVGIPAHVIPDNTREVTPDNPDTSPDITPDSISVELAEARADVARLEGQADGLRQQIDDLREDRDRWHAVATAPRQSWINRLRGAVSR